MVMTVKICANNILYWGTECLLFFHDKYADVDFMASVRPDLERIWAITRRLEAMYREWNVLEYREWRRAIVPTQAFPGMFQRHVDMAGGFDDDGVRARLAATADMMEAFAVLAFSRAAQNLGDAAPGEDVKINPYAVSLDPGSVGGRRPVRRVWSFVGRSARDRRGRPGEPVPGGGCAARLSCCWRWLTRLRGGSAPSRTPRAGRCASTRTPCSASRRRRSRCRRSSSTAAARG